MVGTAVDRLTGLASGVAIKAPCRAATTANITLSGEQTIDGIAVVADDRVLVKDQTDQTQNGIYDVSATAWTRSKDFDGPRDAVKGTQVIVTAGTAAAGVQYQLTTANPITIDTSNITFSALAISGANAKLTALGAMDSTAGLVTQTGTSTFTKRTLTAPAAGITVTNGDGAAGNPTLVLANDLAALEAMASTGLVARTASETYSQRTLTAPAAGITVTNGGGVAGNPTLVLANDLAALEGLSSTGFAVRSTTDTWVQRSLVAGSGIGISNTDGVFADPTISLSANLEDIQDVSVVSAVTGDVLTFRGGIWRTTDCAILNGVVSTQFDKTSNTTLADVTGLSALSGNALLVAAKTYHFRANIFTTSNSAGGIKFAVSGTATATSIVYDAIVTETGVLKVPGTTRATALNTTVGDITAVTVAKVVIEGAITVNAGGTLTIQFAQNASNGAASSVLVGSTLDITRITP